MTKEEKIEEAWGVNLPKKGVSDNGWSIETYHKSDINLNKYDTLRSSEKPVYVIRPKSLQGIENNNGWTKIESEDDLPKESGLYFILDEVDNIIHSEFDVEFGQFFTKDFAYDHYELTHYQPIEKPKPPIY